MAQQSGIGCVAVFGGSGFLGRAVTARLADAGYAVRVAVRHPDAVEPRDRVEAVEADLLDRDSVTRALSGCDAAVNAVSLYVEDRRRGLTFAAIHETGARDLAAAAVAQGLERLVQISGIGADETSPSTYVRARGAGERLVREAFPQATVLRPSVMVGPGDSFVTGLAGVLRASPVFPLFGRGRARLQPLFVGDAAAAIEAVLHDPAAPGRTYELGGPATYSYRELVVLVADRIGRPRPLLPVPFAVWDVLATVATLLPSPPITRSQVTLMRRDNVVGADMPGLAALGVAPTAIESALPAR